MSLHRPHTSEISVGKGTSLEPVAVPEGWLLSLDGGYHILDRVIRIFSGGSGSALSHLTLDLTEK